jgi:nucleoside-diphosphate-sugar epimerase
MCIFVAGASGVIGSQLLPLLIAARKRHTAVASSKNAEP